MDLVETGKHFVLRADLPGLSETDVKVELQDSLLTVSGEHRAEHEDRGEGYHRIERATGFFSRALTLPDGIDPDGIEAHFRDGVLEVRVPKPEQRTPRRVTINLGSDGQTIEGQSRSAEADAQPPRVGAA